MNLNNIITFNGQGCSGKTTQAKKLVKTNPENYQRIHSHKLRSAFEDKVYNHLGRKHENIRYSDGRCQKLSDVEVLGIPTRLADSSFPLERQTISVGRYYRCF